MSTSGYTPCACRDCMEVSISNRMDTPELCLLCKDAGCTPNNGECQVNTCPQCDAPGVTTGCYSCGWPTRTYGTDY